MKKKLVISSIAMITLLTGIVASSTYALFTYESSHTINVSTAKVNYDAILDATSLKTYSLGVEIGTNAFENTPDGVEGVVYDANTNVLTLGAMSPGDEVRFVVNITNTSTINTKFRLKYEVTDLNGGHLSDVLEYGIVYYEEENNETVEKKKTSVDWTFLSPNINPDSILCYMALPFSVGNEYQSNSVEVSVVVEAIQGNADTSNL